MTVRIGGSGKLGAKIARVSCPASNLRDKNAIVTELYDLRADPGETIDLSEQYPEKLTELLVLWRQQRKEMDIILPQDL